jgi:hypothetical protein
MGLVMAAENIMVKGEVVPVYLTKSRGGTAPLIIILGTSWM